MASTLPRGPANRDDREHDHNFLPDFAWAAAGGVGVVAACAILYTLAVTWGGMRLSASASGGAAVPLSTYNAELASLFLAGFLVVLVARSLTARTR